MTVADKVGMPLFGGSADRRRAHRIVGVAAATFAVLLVAAIALGLVASISNHRSTIPSAALPASRPEVSQAAGPAAVPPATVVPAQTPVQQQYDQALASGLSASPTVVAAESAEVPAPAVSTAWPAPPTTNDAQQWTQAFVTELLTINFNHQTRAGLGTWLSAVEAPERLPGVPPDAQNKVLYLSLMDPIDAGNEASPVPDTAQWSALAARHITWSAHNLLIQPDSQWSQIIAAGWQPVDQRFDAYDVSGLLTQTSGTGSTTAHFSLVIYLGSAQWQQGYGTVLVSKWGES
jgi:hypothetical protein